MDLTSFQRGLAGARPATPDYGMLVATLRAAQKAAPPASMPAAPEADWRLLASIILNEADWSSAVHKRGGAFSPGGGKGMATQVTAAFTVAF